MGTTSVVLYTSSMCAMMKQKADISKTRQLLQAKKVDFTELDVASDAQAREAMASASGRKTLPQVHVNGKDIGDSDAIQEMEDFGELDAVLRGETPQPPPVAAD